MKQTAEQFIFSIGRKALKPDKTLTVSEWADRNRVLSSTASSEPGPWRTSRFPFLKMIMDSLSSHSEWQRVVFMKGSQIGGTEIGLNWTGYVIQNSPGPMLMVMETDAKIKEQSKTRLDPMIESCPALSDRVAEPKSRDSGNTITMKEFPGGFLAMCGANSPSALRSKPICYLFLDEVSGYPGDVGGEGDPVNLAIVRTRNFPRRKIFLCSSPTIQSKCRIESAMADAWIHRFYVPCPHCGGFQVLKFSNVKWTEYGLMPSQAVYKCEHCDEKISNHEKTLMLEHGEWRPDIPREEYKGRAIGFHLSALYSPVGFYSWGDAAQDFVESKKDINKLRTFYNTVLGETFQERGDAPDWERLYLRREISWKIGTIPSGGLFLTAGVDVQKDRIEVMVRAWGRDMRNFIIDYRVFAGDTSDIKGEPWRHLDSILGEQFPHENGSTMPIRCMAIDTGYNTQTVYNWCRRYTITRVMPIKGGHDNMSVLLGQPKAVDVVVDGKKKTKALKVWMVGGSIIKQELYGWLKQPLPTDGETPPPGYVHFPEFEEEFFRQLTAEQLSIKDVKGRKIFSWDNYYGRNEVLDTAVYSRAAAAMLQIDKFRDEHWEQLEGMVNSAAKVTDSRPVEPVNSVKRRGCVNKGITI